MSTMGDLAAHITDDDRAELRKLTTARVRRNYWLCQAQLEILHERHATPAALLNDDESAHELYAWQMSYMDELVQRGERV